MEMLPIKRGPLQAPSQETKRKYNFAAMEVGDCFIARRSGRAEDGRDLVQRSIIACAYQWRHSEKGNRDAEFSVRLMEDELHVMCRREK